MIKIIKEGQRNFIAKCPICGCEFSYEAFDIRGGLVVCRYCGSCVEHKLNEYTSRITTTRSTTVDAVNFPQTIRDLCVDYDGFNTVEGLKSLIDDIRAIAEEVVCKERNGDNDDDLWRS